MVPMIELEDQVSIPATITDVEAFRRWARSDDFPERGRFSFLRDKVWVDLSMEQIFTHNQVKAEFAEVLRPLAKAGAFGARSGSAWFRNVLHSTFQASRIDGVLTEQPPRAAIGNPYEIGL